MKQGLFLAVAILFEVLGTTMLKMSDQFTRLVPSLITIMAYIGTFYFLSLSLKTIPIGIAYAVWAGIGIVLVTLVGIVMFKQYPNIPTVIGMLMIIGGVVLINLFSKPGLH